MPTPIITLRPATIDDLARLRHWDAQPHTVASDPEDDWNWATELPRQPDWREQLIAELDGRPLGFIQIIDPALEDGHYWGDTAPDQRAIDIWIGEAEDLGKGYGTVMMQLAIDRCFRPATVTNIIIDPLVTNTRARAFYERLGFRWVENRWFDEDHCAVYTLGREDWNRQQKPPGSQS